MNRGTFSLSVLLVAAVLLAPTALLAQQQGYQGGRHFLELKGGQALNTDGGIASVGSGLEGGNFPILTLAAGTAEQQALALTLYSAQPESEVKGVGGEFLYEYAINDWFGLGAVIANDRYTFENVPGEFSGLSAGFLPLVLGGSSFGGSSTTTTSSTTATLTQQAIFLETLGLVTPRDIGGPNIWTLNFHSTFHFVDRSAWDPYFRIEVGAGQDTQYELTAVRAAGTLGSRFFLGESFYALAEVGYNYYSLSGKQEEGGFGGGSSPVSQDIGETTANIGFGFAL